MEAQGFCGAAGLDRLQHILNRLVLVRRRIKGYDAIIEQQRATCESCGRMGWDYTAGGGPGADAESESEACSGSAMPSELVSQATSAVQADYNRVRELVKDNVQRTDQDLNFAASFTSIEHGKMAVDEAERAATQNQTLMILTFVATFFLPINTVAAILNMTGDFGPGQEKFGMFWAICAPIAIFLVLVFGVVSMWESHLSPWFSRWYV
jgi:Mg2+ and Co2+ transporter CorA